MSEEERVTHPFAVAVFKHTMYWDDWKTSAVYSADKDHGLQVKILITVSFI